MRLILPVVLLVGCGPQPHVPDLPTGGCDAPHYDWVPTDALGRLLVVEHLESHSHDAEILDALVRAGGVRAFSPLPHGVRTWRVRYVTQDRGREVEATALLALPDVPAGTELPVVLWTHPTTGYTDACAPSNGKLADAALPILLASLGNAVAAPDYLGMNGFGPPAEALHPFLVAEPTAVASLDALRALFELAARDEVEVVPDPDRVVIWGPSEGGFAALWADRYQPRYAPEFGVVGVVAAVPPTDFEGIAVELAARPMVDEVSFALSTALVSMVDWYDGAGRADDILRDDAPHRPLSSLLDQMGSSCGIPWLDLDGPEDLFTEHALAAALSRDWDAVQPYACYMQEGTLNQSRIPRESEAPVFLVIGEEDELALPGQLRADVPVLCDQGYRIEVLECAGASHEPAAADSMPWQWDWARDRLDGVPLDESRLCVVPDPVTCPGLQ